MTTRYIAYNFNYFLLATCYWLLATYFPMFICTHCDTQVQKWSGRCFECQHWGTIVEEGSVGPVPVRGTKDARVLNPTKLSDIQKQEETDRYKTDEPEIDRVLGGGIVKGSLLLLSGEPGIGKSTLVADMAKRFAGQNRSVL